MDSGGQAQYQKQMPQKDPVWLRTPEARGPWLPEVHEFFRPMFCSLTLLTMLAYSFFENWSTASRQLNRVWRKSRTVPQTVRPPGTILVRWSPFARARGFVFPLLSRRFGLPAGAGAAISTRSSFSTETPNVRASRMINNRPGNFPVRS